MASKSSTGKLTRYILISMILGAIVGVGINLLPKLSGTYALSPGLLHGIQKYFVDGVCDSIGKIFIHVLEMLVVPIVFVSLVSGCGQLTDTKQFGRLAGKTFVFFIASTVLACSLAMLVASLFHVGYGQNALSMAGKIASKSSGFKDTLIQLFPTNPIAAMASGNMLQIIVFSLLLGFAISCSGEAGERLTRFFADLNQAVMKLIMILLVFAPYGVFALLTETFAKMGFGLLEHLIGYFLITLLVLFVYLTVVYGATLFLFGIRPLPFFKKMYGTMIFAFSSSSSNASIPFALSTAEEQLGLKTSIAAFIIPLGININKNGTAITQGIATVFIANLYHIHLSLMSYAIVVIMSTLASIGTAGVPSVGIITLAMVLSQVGLPVNAIALVLGVDRLLDMARTVINVSGNVAIACIIGKNEKGLDYRKYMGN